MRIAIDIDSTLHHYWDQFSALAATHFGVELAYERQTTWRIAQLPPEDVSWLVAETHGETSIAAAQPYEGAVEAVNRWHAAGHYIHITSHRAGTAHRATERWLEAIGLEYDDLYCSMNKVDRCIELGIELLIDDSPVNLAHAAEAGIATATIRHPWNETAIAPYGVIAARDWPELERLLEPLLG